MFPGVINSQSSVYNVLNLFIYIPIPIYSVFVMICYMLLICGTWYILFMKQRLAPVSALRSEDVWQNYFYTYIRYWLIAMPVIYIKSALCFMK